MPFGCVVQAPKEGGRDGGRERERERERERGEREGGGGEIKTQFAEFATLTLEITASSSFISSIVCSCLWTQFTTLRNLICT